MKTNMCQTTKRKMRSYVIVIVCVQKIIPPPTNCKIFKVKQAKHKNTEKIQEKIIYNMLYLYTAILVKISDLKSVICYYSTSGVPQFKLSQISLSTRKKKEKF